MHNSLTKTLSLGATLLLSTQALARTEPTADGIPAAEATPVPENAPVPEGMPPDVAPPMATTESDAPGEPHPTATAESDAPGEPHPTATAESDAPGSTSRAALTTDYPLMAAEEASGPIPGWFRVDHDSRALQLWVGATHNIGGVDIASDIYINSAKYAQFDIGPAFFFADAAITPMIGIGIDWGEKRAVRIVAPQLFTIYSRGNLYFENWIQFLLRAPFTNGADNDFYTRTFALYQATRDFAIGPQLELTYALSKSGRKEGVQSLPIGGRVNLNYGDDNTLGLFLGIDTEDKGKVCNAGQDTDTCDADNALAGRFTFVRTW